MYNIPPPNKIVRDEKHFYISYNVRDRSIYGSNTTAIVIGNMEYFLILNGDHRKALMKTDYNDTIAYYMDNREHWSKFSDCLPPFRMGD